jgi:DNA-directed RNA polymerase subunit RPC12/RpoP
MKGEYKGTDLEWLETFNMDKIVCPYCFFEESDSWEYNNDLEYGEIEIQCPECSKTFTVNMNVTVKYSTTKIDKENQDEIN